MLTREVVFNYVNLVYYCISLAPIIQHHIYCYIIQLNHVI